MFCAAIVDDVSKKMTDDGSTGSQGPDSVTLGWLNLGKYVNEMFKVQNLKIFCNLPLTSMDDFHAACSTKHQSILPLNYQMLEHFRHINLVVL